jgi:hypothetical protein
MLTLNGRLMELQPEYAEGVVTDLGEIRRFTAIHQAENLAFQRHLNTHHGRPRSISDSL